MYDHIIENGKFAAFFFQTYLVGLPGLVWTERIERSQIFAEKQAKWYLVGGSAQGARAELVNSKEE